VVGGPNGAAVRLGMKRTTLAYRIRKLKFFAGQNNFVFLPALGCGKSKTLLISVVTQILASTCRRPLPSEVLLRPETTELCRWYSRVD